MDYDELVHSKDIQILKSMLPFIDRQQQMPLAIMIQFIELKNTIQIFKNKEDLLSASSIHNESDRKTAMMEVILKNIVPEYQETINQMMHMINMMNMMNENDMSNDDTMNEVMADIFPN